MLIVTNLHGTVRVDSSGSARKKEREEAYEKQASSHPLPWALHPTCVSKWREQTPKINRWSQTRFFTSFLIPLEKHKEKREKGVCAVCRPSRCVYVYVQGTGKVSQIYA